MSAKNKLSLTVQYPDARLEETIPRPLLRRWVQAALLGPAQLNIRFVDAVEGQALNRDYRGKDYATNVLTFAYNEGEAIADDEPTVADIILCTDVLQREAIDQKKPWKNMPRTWWYTACCMPRAMTTWTIPRRKKWKGSSATFWKRSAIPTLTRLDRERFLSSVL